MQAVVILLPCLQGIKDYLVSLSPAASFVMSEIRTALKLVMVMPATNGVRERSESALRIVKPYYEATMKQARLNSLMTPHVHTDMLSIELSANEFVARREH